MASLFNVGLLQQRVVRGKGEGAKEPLKWSDQANADLNLNWRAKPNALKTGMAYGLTRCL